MKPKGLLLLHICALVVFLSGALAAFAVIFQNLELRGKIRNKIETLDQLLAMKQMRDRHQAAVRAFEGVSNALPVSLASLSRAIVTNATPEIREREARNLADGWTLWQMEVVFSELNLGQVPDFLREAEMQRPPWRLVECSIASSRQADGVGRVVLIMEAVGKTGDRTAESGRRTTEDKVQNQ